MVATLLARLDREYSSRMSPVDVQVIIDRTLASGRFFVAPPGRLRIETAHEAGLRWEIYLGHLLDPAFARNEISFVSWHVFLDDVEPAAAPLISIRWNVESNRIFVTRQILTHAFEAFEDAPGVILTRPAQKWATELVGTIELAESPEAEIEHDLSQLLLLAVIGTSRLPITSLESPIPNFSLGRLAYQTFTDQQSEVSHDAVAWLTAGLAGEHDPLAQAKALETALRAAGSRELLRVTEALETFAAQPGDEIAQVNRLLRDVFNGAALSPYTHFSDALVELIERLAERPWFGPQAALTALSYMLRHLCRHLTAFDLTLFHNFGANYPDALFLDALLKAYLKLLEGQPDLTLAPTRRVLRRALRQACLARKQYEGHRVPDSPTSMGENARVLPAPFSRVPDVQIIESGKRSRRLYDDEPTDGLLNEITRRALQMSLNELDDPRELQELGTAIYLDRPLGALKQPGEVDRTPLVSYEAYSRFIAARRLATLKSARWIDNARHETLRAALANVAVVGVPAAEITARERPGVVSLTDANKAASDFVIIRTTRRSLSSLLAHYDWRPLESRFPTTCRWLLEDANVLLVQHASTEPPGLPVFAGNELRLELGFPGERSTMAIYPETAGQEVVSRLQILRVTDEDGRLVDLKQSSLWITATTISRKT
jgi:hypothetical protein